MYTTTSACGQQQQQQNMGKVVIPETKTRKLFCLVQWL